MRKSELSRTWQELILWMQSINFGRFENLQFRAGDPCLDPPPRLIREYRSGGDNGVRKEAQFQDFVLRREIVELYAVVQRQPDTCIDVLEVKHGVPFRWSMEVNLSG